MKRCYFLSDLHLETQYANFPYHLFESNTKDWLFIVGDTFTYIDKSIDCYYDFVLMLAYSFEKVFIVLGNHDYYGYTLRGGLNKLKFNLKKLKNVIVLDHTTQFQEQDIAIFGDTLWSNIPSQAESWIEGFGDFAQIKGTYASNLTVYETNDWNIDARKSLQLFLKSPAKTKIVLTHFPPFYINCGYPDSLSNYYFGNSGLEWEIDDFPDYWIYGHIHNQLCYHQMGCNFLTNPKGYGRQGRDLLLNYIEV